MMIRVALTMTAALALLAGPALYAQESDDADDSADPDAGKKIYKVRDDEGNVTFTDEPPKDRDSEEVRLRQGNDMSLEAVDLPESPTRDEDAEEQIDYEVRITSPKEEETFQHPTEPIPIEYALQPELKSGHSLEFLHNGEVLDNPELDYPDRGTHNVRVRVVDGDGDSVAQSEPRTFFVHRPSKQLPPNN